MNQLFFELIQVAIGVRACLSHSPNKNEWEALYAIAQRQSLVGISFVGVQKLLKQMQKPSEDLCLTWIGMAAKIQQKNEVLNRQCAELQTKFSADGFRSCVLKGQGVATFYGKHLRGLRQSGDIDVLIWKEGISFHKNRQEVIAYAHSMDATACGAEHHIGVHLFEDTDVEMHYAPAYFCNPFANMRFRRWFECEREHLVKVEDLDLYMPSAEFNIVFLLAHSFRHYMSEGVGLRQLMDYYFVLKSLSNSNLKGEDLKKTLSSLNMLKFAGAVMWVMNEVFGMSEQYMICEANKRLGRKLLAHVMQGGNFGHHNTETIANKQTHVGRFINQVAQDLSLSFDYPAEALWAPISMIREFIRIRI